MKEDSGFYKATFARLSDEKKEKIRGAAVEIFAENGYANAKMKTIAAAAGISVGSLYQYFDTKEEIFLDALQTMRRELEYRFEDAVPVFVPSSPCQQNLQRNDVRRKFSSFHPYREGD